MNNHDPLYDTNTPGSDETIDDVLSEQDSGFPSMNANDESGQEKLDQIQSKADELSSRAEDKAGEVGDKVQGKASELGDAAQQKTDAGMDKAASGLGSAADALREQGNQQGGTVGGFATTVADKLDGASGYLRDKDSDQIVTDLEELVRRKPMESLLAAAGIGLLLSRIVR